MSEVPLYVPYSLDSEVKERRGRRSVDGEERRWLRSVRGEYSLSAVMSVKVKTPHRRVDVRLPGKGNSNSHGARPVHLIITKIKWFRTVRRE